MSKDYCKADLKKNFLILHVTAVRKARESHLIDKVMTLEPHGLNLRDELL